MSADSIARELEAVDDALATGSVAAADPVERELRELALALRADAPAPDPAFAAALRERMETGFPPARDSARGRLATALRRGPEAGKASSPRAKPGRGRPAAASRRGPHAAGAGWTDADGGGRVRRAIAGFGPTQLGAGALAALLIAIVVAVGLNRGTETATDGAASGGGATALQEPAPEADRAVPGALGAEPQAVSPDDGAAQSIAPAPPTAMPLPRNDFAPGREQRIARAAALTLSAPGDELGRLAERVTAVTDRHRGFVLRSSVTSAGAGDADAAGGSLELRIPAARLRDAVRDLSALATVTSSTQSGEDVTGRFVSARDRLTAARAERAGLLKRLAAAETDLEAESIRRRLDLVAGEINGLRGQLRRLRLQTDYAAVNVTLEPSDGDAGAVAPGSTRDALDDALGSLQTTLNVALRTLGVALPLALLALLGWALARLVRRRRRESALA